MTTPLHDLLTAFDAELPLERARTIPAGWYRDAAVSALERKAVFGDVWQVACRAAEVAAPGSFVTTEIAGEPILVVRGEGEGGVLRAFSNVCRHRAAPVMTQRCGTATRLRCPYHGWTYDLAGRLRGAPEFDGVADFRREDFGLPSLTADVWGPWVWVHGGKSPPPLVDYLAPLWRDEDAAELARLRFAGRREYDVACNWKVYVDNFLDGGYHVHAVHPALAGVLDYAHYHTEIHENTSVQRSPVKSAVDDDAAARTRSGEARYWWVFPNFMINLYSGVMDTNLVLPLGPDRCRVVFEFFFARTEGPEAEAFVRESIAVADQVQKEDIWICEKVQGGLGSRSYDTGRFSVRREVGAYHFHRLLSRRLRGAAG
jgi:choline monooxygenase